MRLARRQRSRAAPAVATIEEADGFSFGGSSDNDYTNAAAGSFFLTAVRRENSLAKQKHRPIYRPSSSKKLLANPVVLDTVAKGKLLASAPTKS